MMNRVASQIPRYARFGSIASFMPCPQYVCLATDFGNPGLPLMATCRP